MPMSIAFFISWVDLEYLLKNVILELRVLRVFFPEMYGYSLHSFDVIELLFDPSVKLRRWSLDSLNGRF